MIIIDVIALALAKSYTNKVAAGFSSVSVDEPTSTIIFNLIDGSTVSLKIPRPKDGVSIIDIYQEKINNEWHLICKLSNDEIIDAGALPEPEVKISPKEGNALIKEEDGGLYVATSGVKISPLEDNSLKQLEDGSLYVPNVNEQEEDILNIITKNIETENIDFSKF